jgi:hypothetical protein
VGAAFSRDNGFSADMELIAYIKEAPNNKSQISNKSQ